MIVINKPGEFQDVQCYKCKTIMKVHPMNNMNSDYFTNCELHMKAEVIEENKEGILVVDFIKE